MSVRQSLACNVAPIFLRLALGATFVWAGLSKLLAEDVVVGPDNAAALVEVGAVAAKDVEGMLPQGFVPPSERTPPTTEDPEAPGEGESFFTPPAGDGRTGGGSTRADPSHDIVLVQDATPAGPKKLKRLFGLAIGIHAAARDSTDAQGNKVGAILPAFMGQGEWPKYLAWTVTFTEIFAGGFLLLGFLSRICGLALAGVMGTAIWMTQVGPAIQSGNTRWGFMPAHDAFDPGAWTTFGWQIALLCASLAVLFSGAGALSLDRLLFAGGAASDDGDDGD